MIIKFFLGSLVAFGFVSVCATVGLVIPVIVIPAAGFVTIGLAGIVG